MEVPEKLSKICEDLKSSSGARQLYVLDIVEEPSGESAGTIVFGVRDSTTPPLSLRVRAGEVLEKAIGAKVATLVFTDALDEVEYLFDRYLRTYIGSHGGSVTPVRVEEAEGRLWIRMDGGCSGCPSSLATLKHGIERTLKDHLPWVRQVEAVNEAVEPDFGIHLDLAALATASAKEVSR